MDEAKKRRNEMRSVSKRDREERGREYGTRIECVVRLLILGRWQQCDKAIWRNGLLLEPITTSRERGIKTRKDRLNLVEREGRKKLSK